jgi:hypothetical protein
VGEWRDNKKNGYGVFYYHSGAVYEGHFVDDLRQGQGKLTFMAGSSVEEGYEGTWERDEWHRHGIYRYRKEEGALAVVLKFSLSSLRECLSARVITSNIVH